MDAEEELDFERDMSKRVADATQAAVDATDHAHAAAPHLDVEQCLRAELESRGVTLDDSAWVTEVARLIRDGMPIVVGDPDRSVGQ